MIKVLQIISPTKAREINKLGKEPDRFKNYGQGCIGTSVEWDIWFIENNKLKEYTITNPCDKICSMQCRVSPVDCVKAEVGSKWKCEVNEDNLTAIIL